MVALGLSMHPNDTHPTSYQEVAHFHMGEGRGPLPNLHPTIYELFKFCVIDVLPVPVNLLNNLFTLFDAKAHKTNNTTVPACMVH